MLNRWKTEREQGLLVGLSFAGIGIANSVTYPISGLLCEYSGWQSIFYFAGKLHNNFKNLKSFSIIA